MSRVQDRAEEMISRHGFLGVPVATFALAGRQQMIGLLEAGLNPESKVLDIGSGCLRVAYWLIRFLDPGCYYGIEPARQRVDCGLRYLFTAEEVECKRPRFDFNPDFDSSGFATRFDFFSRDQSGPTPPNLKSKRRSIHLSALRSRWACFSRPTCRPTPRMRIIPVIAGVSIKPGAPAPGIQQKKHKARGSGRPPIRPDQG
jgi:hypothetical protein